MPFKNREEAGVRLSEKLLVYKNNSDVIVIALPRGGVVLGKIIADTLNAPLDIVVPRKIGAPDNEECAIGALTENGGVVWNETERDLYPKQAINAIIEKERQESKRRLKAYRKGLPPRILTDKIIILVDDGVATGYTIRSAIKTIKQERPKRIVVAIPGGPFDTLALLKRECDELIVLDVPKLFWAVGQLYENFSQTTDEEVVALLSSRTKRRIPMLRDVSLRST